MGRGDDRNNFLVIQLQDVTLLRHIADEREYHNIDALLGQGWTWERIATAIDIDACELRDRWKQAGVRLDVETG